MNDDTFSYTDKSIAVLPFVNMSASKENEFFSDGITEEIINALAKIPELIVTSRTSSFLYKNKNIPINQIGKELNVSTILEGSVRVAGEIIRITAQLIHAEKDFHFWSETWDRKLENLFEIQDEISLIIAEKLREFLGHFEIADHLVSKQTENLNAYQLFLKGRFYFRKWNPTDVKEAITYFEKAVELDGNHAESILGMADCYSFLATTGFMPFQEAWDLAEKFTHQALAINYQLADGHYQLANLYFFTKCDFMESLKSALKAVSFNPNFVEAQQYLAFLYTVSGDMIKAKSYLDVAVKIDPISQETLFYRAYFDYMSENYLESLQQLDKIIENNPQNIPAHSIKCYCLLQLGKYDEALYYYDKLPDQIVVEGDKIGIKTLAFTLMGDKNNAESCYDKLIEYSKTPQGFRESSFLLFIYAVKNEPDKAFEWIKNAIQEKSPLLLIHFSDPFVNSIKSDPRYKQYQREIFPNVETKSELKSRKKLLTSDQIEHYLAVVDEHFASEKPFLDPALSLRKLAEQIKIHPNQLSWLINENTGKNFNEFINHYRIEYFKRIVNDPDYKHLNLIGLAFEAGFNSKTVFNTYFKKETGITPKKYLNRHK